MFDVMHHFLTVASKIGGALHHLPIITGIIGGAPPDNYRADFFGVTPADDRLDCVFGTS